MNWIPKDVDTYISQKEYIDTVVVPLIAVDTKPETMKNSASSSEFLMNLSKFIEKQFKGRMMFLPPVSYTQSTDIQQLADTLSEDLKKSSFLHIFYLTTDPKWTSVSTDEKVIWLPSIPLETMDDHLRQTIMEDQLRQVLTHFMDKWNGQQVNE
ncbi:MULTISPECIES: DUF2487 family protein [unclassified Sporosarcina]|uniref:DUF2487 family protein n=1 Tax=unclassified Sporosarcina TaxID=2647733 RepID=UPI00203D2738|nr:MULTISPECIES: DUF2487 family protein [unclassified Sporosarcina]GKV65690.1 hypothetical protein NCCP2331_18430 [Sporosarcina sp. NCCP-2331]GLB55730.1 hypothetical protein NCCP2378_15170 [Sporosarcina sp. NCCP-2378]